MGEGPPEHERDWQPSDPDDEFQRLTKPLAAWEELAEARSLHQERWRQSPERAAEAAALDQQLLDEVEQLRGFQVTGDRVADTRRFLELTNRQRYIRSAAELGYDPQEYLPGVREAAQSMLEHSATLKETDIAEDPSLELFEREIPRLTIQAIDAILAE